MASLSRIWNTVLESLRGHSGEYTHGSIDRAIVLLAVPMIMEMIMEALFALVDIFYVSRISTQAVAAVGLTEVVLMIIESVAFGIGMAATAMVARRVGENHTDDASRAAVQTIWLSAILSLSIGLICYFNAGSILHMMGGSEELIEGGYRYTQIVLGLNATLFFIIILNSIFRGVGDAAIAMQSLILANGLNIVLDPIFIFGLGPIPEMGLTGAAIATVIGRSAGIAYQLYHLSRPGHVIQIQRRHLVWVQDLFQQIVHLAFGTVGQFLINSLSWIVIVRVISAFGDIAVAGYTIGFRIIVFTILPAWGLAMAAATLVGQNLGAGKPDRAERSTWRCAFFCTAFLTGVALVFFFIGPIILPYFDPNPEVIAEGTKCLRIIFLGYIIFGYGMVISQAFNGAGDTRTPVYLNIVAFWIVQIPLSYLLSVYMGWGTTGAYWAINLSNALLAGLAIYLFKQGRWKRIEV